MVRRKMNPKMKRDESKDEKGPSEDNCVRAGTRCKGNSCDVGPETRNRDDRQGIDYDDPWWKGSRLDRTTPAELDKEHKGKDRTSDRAGQRPDDRVGDMDENEKRGNQGESGDQKATFNVEAHEAEVAIGEFASQRTSESNDHCREADE